MDCRYCGKETNLVNAHVIPEGFFRRLRNGQDPPRLLTNKANEYPKKAPVGVYDTNILCEKCEPLFGDWDNYAQQFLTEQRPPGEVIYSEGQRVAYKVQKYDYAKLKLFFLSLIWRASVSEHPFYNRIKLGPFEKAAKDLIERCEPGSEHEFGVTLAKFDHPLGTAILNPHPEKREGINYCRFYLGSYVAYIKMDKRISPKPLGDFLLTPRPPLYIICRNLEKSKELPLMRKIALSANSRLQPTRKRRD